MTDISNLPVLAELVHYPDVYDGSVGDALADVLSEVASERYRQMTLGFDDAHDDGHGMEDLEDYVRSRLLKAVAARREGFAHGYRERLVQVAALAVAAIQSWDRRHSADEAQEAAHG